MQAQYAQFLEEPRIGSRLRLMLNGQPATTSPVTGIQADPSATGRIYVYTQSGSCYCCAGQSVEATVYGATAASPVSSFPNLRMAPDYTVPAEVRQGYNWGAFLLAVPWCVTHRVWIGLLSLVPVLTLPVAFALLIKGNEWGWQNRHFESVEQFAEVQRRWMIAGLAVLVLSALFASSVAAVVSALDQAMSGIPPL